MRKILTILFLLAVNSRLIAGDYEYKLSWEQASSHLYHISLVAEAAAGAFTDFQIPAWRPGRYFEQRYAAAVSDFSAFDSKGKKLSWKKTERDTWQVNNPNTGKIEIRYRYYANELDAGSSYLSTTMAYFNPANCFMHVRDRYEVPCTLTVTSLPDNWKAATALKIQSAKVFTATDYHEFVDSPTILSSTLTQFSFEVNGTTFWFHFQGNFAGGKATQDTLIKNTTKIIRTQKAVFGDMPLREYHFLVQLLPYNFRHAVEHSNSSCYALPETVAKDPAAIASMYGILSHEFFHLWNVKRIRPAALWPYDYQRTPFTSLHWFTEGVTDYYTDLTLVRAGIITRENYFKSIANSFSALENNYAAGAISPAQASFDSWLSGSEYADPHRQVSYYPLGERAGFLLDLQMRKVSKGTVTLDDLMRYLYKNYYQQNLGVPENGILEAAEKLTGESFDDFFSSYVEGTDKIDFRDFVKTFGLEWETEENKTATWQKIGIDRTEKVPNAIVLSSIRPDGEAAAAGLSDGDYILSINGKDPGKFDEKEFFEKLHKNDEIKLEIFRDGTRMNIQFDFKEKKLPVIATLKVDDKLKEKEKMMLESWLSPEEK